MDSITVFLILDLRFAILGAVPEGIFAFGGGLERGATEERRARRDFICDLGELAGTNGEGEMPGPGWLEESDENAYPARHPNPLRYTLVYSPTIGLSSRAMRLLHGRKKEKTISGGSSKEQRNRPIEPANSRSDIREHVASQARGFFQQPRQRQRNNGVVQFKATSARINNE
jgi:hypothetical protein